MAHQSGTEIGVVALEMAEIQSFPKIAEFLSQQLRNRDFVCDVEGCLFVLLPGLQRQEDLYPPLTRLTNLISSEVKDQLMQKFSVAIYPRDGINAETLIKAAKLFLETGKILDVAAIADIRSDLWTALKLNQIQTWYQPKIDLKKNELIGAEALVRWAHPIKGVLMPDSFLPLAEESGAIVQLGAQVLADALQQLAHWSKIQPLNLTMAINITPQQFLDPEFVVTLKKLCLDLELSPNLIQLEITETSLLQDLVQAQAIAQSLSELGFQLAIDDFGIGYSSLALLQQLPVCALKIDRSFIAYNSTKDDLKRKEILRGIISLAQALNIKTIAEGVEEEAQRLELLELDCDEAQGFIFGRPLPALEFTDHWLRN